MEKLYTKALLRVLHLQKIPHYFHAVIARNIVFRMAHGNPQNNIVHGVQLFREVGKTHWTLRKLKRIKKNISEI